MLVTSVVRSPDETKADNFHAMSAPIVFDRKVYAARRLRAERRHADNFLVRHAAENLSDSISAVKRGFGRALDLGSRRQSFELLSRHADSWIRSGPHRSSRAVELVADDEFMPFATYSFDLIVSVLGLHAVNDLPG